MEKYCKSFYLSATAVKIPERRNQTLVGNAATGVNVSVHCYSVTVLHCTLYRAEGSLLLCYIQGTLLDSHVTGVDVIVHLRGSLVLCYSGTLVLCLTGVDVGVQGSLVLCYSGTLVQGTLLDRSRCECTQASNRPPNDLAAVFYCCLLLMLLLLLLLLLSADADADTAAVCCC